MLNLYWQIVHITKLIWGCQIPKTELADSGLQILGSLKNRQKLTNSNNLKKLFLGKLS